MEPLARTVRESSGLNVGTDDLAFGRSRSLIGLRPAVTGIAESVQPI